MELVVDLDKVSIPMHTMGQKPYLGPPPAQSPYFREIFKGHGHPSYDKLSIFRVSYAQNSFQEVYILL